MSDKKKTVVPRLRFPEFRDAGPWEVKRLGEVCEILDNLRKPVTSTHRKSGPYPYYGASGVIDYIDQYIFDERLLLIGEDGAKWGPFEKTAFIVDGKYWVNNHAHVLRPKNVVDTLLEGFLTATDISPYVTGAAPPKLTLDNLKAIRVPVPPARTEQQKIADCLSSLDELIELEVKRLDALKAHKKGLLQQLFPREGETTPRLRFPEFRDAGPWQKGLLGNLCKIRTGKKDVNEGAENGAYPFFTCAEKHTYSNSYSFDAEAILVAGNANVGQTTYYKGKFEAYQRTYVLSDFTDINVAYLYAFLSGNLRRTLLSQMQSSAMTYIKLPMLQEYVLSIPPTQTEQQKIADCLSSLDELIQFQAKRLEALKAHKKGLMQQLFPQEVA